MTDSILALDQGTTSTRAILYDAGLRPITSAQEEFDQHFPHSGWVEHEAMDLWHTSKHCVMQVLAETGAVPTALGLTNQRETTVVWDAETGEPLHRAIVWQDRRTADLCARLR